eukprot:TRINITY_DN80247_c0_g1_i1.p2 TRINITY_DN80247_c0_g1~~TRINITY_DN80247_c0_g1_i1.p2  ORF type:complete len:264 (-),score=49.40 TRINITY_DN80247_c0_g1_i1:109-879(-)
MPLRNFVALVTGAASGLGKATATRFVRQGGRVVIVDLPASQGKQVAAELGDRAVFAPADVTNEEHVKQALDLAEKTFGESINVAVSCAGIARAVKVLGKNGPHPFDVFAQTLQINTFGTFNIARLSAARIAARAPDAGGQRGVIVNTASVAAYDGQIGQVAYAASKGAVVAMTLPMARDLAPNGIRVNTIAPGIMMTPMMAGLPQKAQDSLAQLVPFPPRLGDPDEYAQLVEAIVLNRYLNGEVIRLDGSLRMPPK